MAEKKKPEDEVEETEEAVEPDDEPMFFEDADPEGDFAVDLSDVSEDAVFEAIPAGTYPMEILEAEYGASQAGNPMITWQLGITDGEYANRRIFYHTVMNNDFGLARLKRLLVRLAPDLDLANFNPKRDLAKLAGRQGQVVLRVRRRDGEPRSEVRDILPAEGDSFFENE